MSKKQMRKESGSTSTATPSFLKRDKDYSASLDALMAEIKKISVATEEIKASQEKTGKVLVRHEETITDHEKRIAALEGAKKCAQPEREVESQPDPQPQPAKAVDPRPDPVSRSAYAGFTGKALVFFIHKNGRIDYSRPFYSPNVAKLYDWHYAIVPAWVENGIYVRPLNEDEAFGIMW